jgi:predicted nucleic acid-binding protein
MSAFELSRLAGASRFSSRPVLKSCLDLEVIDRAAQARLTTCDASYLWLARKTGGQLVTLDKPLRKVSGA